MLCKEILKIKSFDILAWIDIIVSVRRLVLEIMMPSGSSFYGIKKTYFVLR